MLENLGNVSVTLKNRLIGGQIKQKRKKVTLKLSICQNLHMTMINMRIFVDFASRQNGIIGAFQRVVDQPEWK